MPVFEASLLRTRRQFLLLRLEHCSEPDSALVTVSEGLTFQYMKVTDFDRLLFFALHRDLDGLNSSSHHANISHLEESAQSLPEPSRVAKDWDEFFMVNIFQCL
jgi:hypothetical protein